MRDCWRGVSFSFSRGKVDVTGSVSIGVERAVAGWESLSDRLRLDTDTVTVLFVTLLRAAKVVPRLVDDKAAPAAKASRGLYPKPVCRRAKDSAVGVAIPVSAQKIDKGRLDSRTGRLVESPPRYRHASVRLNGMNV